MRPSAWFKASDKQGDALSVASNDAPCAARRCGVEHSGEQGAELPSGDAPGTARRCGVEHSGDPGAGSPSGDEHERINARSHGLRSTPIRQRLLCVDDDASDVNDIVRDKEWVPRDDVGEPGSLGWFL